MKNQNHIGNFLKEHLTANNISERNLAKKCKMSHSYLNQIIKGCNPTTGKPISPTIKTLEKLSEGLNLDVDSLQQIARGINPQETCIKSALIKNIEDSATDEGIKVGSNSDRIIPWKVWYDIKNALKLTEAIDFDPSDSSNEDWEAILKDIQLVITLHKNR